MNLDICLEISPEKEKLTEDVFHSYGLEGNEVCIILDSVNSYQNDAEVTAADQAFLAVRIAV